MVPILPNELLARIIECVAYRDNINDLLHTYEIKVLPSLCLVSKDFYALAAPLLYRDIIIRTNYTLSSIAPKLVPLLSRDQKRHMGTLALDEHNVPLVDQERMVNPLWVRRLILLEDTDVSSSTGLFWDYIEEVAQNIENLQFICWESSYHSPRLLQSLCKMRRLSHVTCRNTNHLLSPRLEPWLGPLKYFSVYHYKPYGGVFTPSSPENLHQVLQQSNSLRELHLAFHGMLPSEVDSTVSGLFKENSPTGPYNAVLLPNMENLSLTGYEESTVAGLMKIIDFSQLKSLQLVRREESGCLPRALQQQSLRFLQRLSVCLVPSSAVDILMRCEGLQEIHIVYQDDDPQKLSDPTQSVLEAVLKHGSTLRALTLFGTYCQYSPIAVDGFAKLASGCPRLEDLRVNLDFADWSQIVTQIAKLLSLKHLGLDTIYKNTESPYIVEGEHVLTCHGEPWLYPGVLAEYRAEGYLDELNDYCAENQLTELEKALGRLLEASVNHAMLVHNTIQGPCDDRKFSWRDYSKLRTVTFTTEGLNPISRSEILSQSYFLREGELVRTFEEDKKSWPIHGVRWLAPPGHLYSYNTPDVSITVETMAPFPRQARVNARTPTPTVGAWVTAFKAASDATDMALTSITQMTR